MPSRNCRQHVREILGGIEDDVRSANLLFFYCADVLEREQRQVLCTPHGLLDAGHDACALAPFVQLATQSLRLDFEGADFASSKGTLAALSRRSAMLIGIFDLSAPVCG